MKKLNPLVKAINIAGSAMIIKNAGEAFQGVSSPPLRTVSHLRRRRCACQRQ